MQSFQLHIFMIFKSFLTSFSHLVWGLPNDLIATGFHSSSFFVRNSRLTNSYYVHEEIKDRLVSGNACKQFGAGFLWFRLLSRRRIVMVTSPVEKIKRLSNCCTQVFFFCGSTASSLILREELRCFKSSQYASCTLR
jgi:hypothetical protein